MITRIVKMTFHPETIQAFLQLFEERKTKIKNTKGCRHLELLQEKKEGLVCFTYSIWDNENALNNYRQSDFFKETWQLSRKGFAQKAEAWSTTLQAILKD